MDSATYFLYLFFKHYMSDQTTVNRLHVTYVPYQSMSGYPCDVWSLYQKIYIYVCEMML